MAKIVSFEDVQKGRQLNLRFEYEVFPYELGLTPEDVGVGATEKVAVKFRPLSTAELGQVLMQVKDIDPPLYAPARDELIVQACLVEPQLPAGVAGNAILQNWLPGTVAILASEAQKKSGYDEHVVKNATAELGN